MNTLNKPACYYCKKEQETLYSLTYVTDKGMGSHAVCSPEGCPEATDRKL